MRKMAGKCAAVLLAMVSLLSVFGCAANEGAYRGAETPEQEISMFLQAISDKEPKEELLKFFPVAWMAENYEVSHLPEQQVEKYRDPEFHLETFQTGLPVLIGSLFLNEEGTMAQGYELPDGFDPLGEEALDLLVKNTDFLTRQIREPIQILRCDRVEQIFWAQTDAQAYFQQRAQMIGAEDAAEYTVFVEYEGQTYMMGFTLAQYRGMWYITDLSSTAAQLPSVPSFRRITLEEYEKGEW